MRKERETETFEIIRKSNYCSRFETRYISILHLKLEFVNFSHIWVITKRRIVEREITVIYKFETLYYIREVLYFLNVRYELKAETLVMRGGIPTPS